MVGHCVIENSVIPLFFVVASFKHFVNLTTVICILLQLYSAYIKDISVHRKGRHLRENIIEKIIISCVKYFFLFLMKVKENKILIS